MKYRLRLKVRLGKSVYSDKTALTATIAGREVTIKAEDSGQPLSEASWVIMGSRDFETEDLARQFGEKLRRATHLAGLCARVGVDAGDPGEDQAMSWVNPEAISQDLRRAHPDIRFGPDVHGIVVLPDDENTVFMSARAEATVLSNAEDFIQALEEALPRNDAPLGGSSPIRRAIRILSLAEMNKDPIAKAVLAIATVEGLAVDQSWPPGQVKLIKDAADWLESTHGDKENVQQVIEVIRRVRPQSIRQGIKKLLETNDLSSLWPDWEALYNKRSRLLHDNSSSADSEAQGDHLERTELSKLGREAVTLCAKIVLSIAKRDGMSLPDCARVHFGVE